MGGVAMVRRTFTGKLTVAVGPAVAALAIGAAIPAAGGTFAFEGRYAGGDRSYRQVLAIARRADGGFDVSATVGMDGCSGDVEARGEASGDTLTAEAVEDNTCILTIRRVGTGLSVDATNCVRFHGASCDFAGLYRRRR